MKKRVIIIIWIAILLLSYLSDLAFSMMEKAKWSNYTQSWETKWTTSRAIKVVIKFNQFYPPGLAQKFSS